MSKLRLKIDVDYLHQLLKEYETIKVDNKEKINVRNSIIELLIPAVEVIILSYRRPFDWDMFQEASIDLISQIDSWDSSRTKRRKLGDAGDLSFFVVCIRNFCKNYMLRDTKTTRRETLIDPLEHSYWDSLTQYKVPRRLYITGNHEFDNKNKQKAYECFVDSFLGDGLEHVGTVELRKKIWKLYGLTYRETEEIMEKAIQTIENHIEGIDNG